MTLEPVGSFFRNPPRDNYLSRIYRSHILQQELVALLGEGAVVVVKPLGIRLVCENQHQATLAKMRRTKILAIIHRSLRTKTVKLQILVKRA